MDHDNTQPKPRVPAAKPRLALAPAPAPRARRGAKVAKFPEAGSFERLWRTTMLKAPKTILGSWLLGAGKILATGMGAWMAWDASRWMGAWSAPILDGWARTWLRTDLGLSSLAAAHPWSARPLLGLSLCVGALLALRWAAWLAVDAPVAIGAKSGPLPDERRPAHKLPLRLGSWGSFCLHLLSAATFVACVGWAGKGGLEQTLDKLAEATQSALGHAAASASGAAGSAGLTEPASVPARAPSNAMGSD